MAIKENPNYGKLPIKAVFFYVEKALKASNYLSIKWKLQRLRK
ncbi:MAG: hypothetical protein JW390_10001 [Nitrosopumilus sp.]|nr:hypothetical protein [Candidatus Nitrosopumilus limneticus]